MPVFDQVEDITDIACDCCGFKTVFSSGYVVLDDDQGDDAPEMDYLARWTDGKGDHDVFLLVYIEEEERYASVIFSFDDQSFSVIEPGDTDWGEIEEDELLSRKEIIDTPLAETLFKALDEIWEWDKSLVKFAELVMLSKESSEEGA